MLFCFWMSMVMHLGLQGMHIVSGRGGFNVESMMRRKVAGMDNTVGTACGGQCHKAQQGQNN